MLDAISKCLTESKVNFIRIDGSTRHDLRAAYIDRFQKNKSCQVAVLSLKGIRKELFLDRNDMIQCFYYFVYSM